jgi:DNA-binding transcriptional LysR family regulator
MTAPQLSKIDLNLLVVLDVLLREKSVGKAAVHLNLTSSAVSHALKRLRLLFDNELLVRDGRLMVPTERGAGLAETLPQLLARVEQTIIAPEPFAPRTSTRSFRLAAPDFFAPIMPNLVQAIADEAPGVSVEIASFSPTVSLDAQKERCDALIAPSFRQTDDLRSIELGEWSWATFGRMDHPAFSDWSLESWARFPHVVVSASSPSGNNPIDRLATDLGVSRETGVVVPQFSMAAPILAVTDMLLTVPSIAMQGFDAAFRLDHRDLPFKMNPIKLSLFYDARSGDEPDVRWFRDQVVKASENLAN